MKGKKDITVLSRMQGNRARIVGSIMQFISSIWETQFPPILISKDALTMS